MFQLQDTNTLLLVPGAEGKLNIKLNETAVTDYRAGWLPLHQGKVSFPPGKVSERQAGSSASSGWSLLNFTEVKWLSKA